MGTTCGTFSHNKCCQSEQFEQEIVNEIPVQLPDFDTFISELFPRHIEVIQGCQQLMDFLRKLHAPLIQRQFKEFIQLFDQMIQSFCVNQSLFDTTSIDEWEKIQIILDDQNVLGELQVVRQKYSLHVPDNDLEIPIGETLLQTAFFSQRPLETQKNDPAI